MSLIDTLEHYYGERDEQGNLTVQQKEEPVDELFDELFEEDEDELYIDDEEEDEHEDSEAV